MALSHNQPPNPHFGATFITLKFQRATEQAYLKQQKSSQKFPGYCVNNVWQVHGVDNKFPIRKTNYIKSCRDVGRDVQLF